MKQGYLSQYFTAVAAKKLSTVEVNSNKSNQHEFNGSNELKAVLRTTERTKFKAKFLWIGDQNEALSEDDTVTWYDARENHPKRSEYRLYFHSNPIMDIVSEGDTMFIAMRTDGSILITIASQGSTIESQLRWLFGLTTLFDGKFELSEIEDGKDQEVDFTVRFILDELGIEIEEPENDYVDGILKQFSGRFPSTNIFSSIARSSLRSKVSPIEEPDETLIAYMNWEEKLFRRLERHIVENRLKEGFDKEGVDGFMGFSLSVQNRRKSRVGYAFEDHLKHIFGENKLIFSNGKSIAEENKSKPDFLFPGLDYYVEKTYPSDYLTVLGAKTTCKDRWRQVLSEANRVEKKHLLTLEPGITENQTDEMKAKHLQLVLPKAIHTTYTAKQQEWLMSVKDFTTMVADRQAHAIRAGLIK